MPAAKKNMADWMCEDWMCELGVDLEAQRRELERLEQARRDRLVAEELQGDLAALPLPREGEKDEKDCSAHHTPDTDKQLSLMMTTMDSSYPVEDLPGPSQRREQTTFKAWTSPSQRRHCWDDVMPESHSSSGSGSGYCTPSELRSRSPISPLTNLTPSTHVPPTSSLNHSPSAHPTSITPITHHPSPPHESSSATCHFSSTASDQKLAEQLQEMEKRERERCEKLATLDHHLAMELMREETVIGEEREAGEEGIEDDCVLEKMKKQIDMISQSKTDAELAMALQEAEKQGRGWEGEEEVQFDHNLAQRLQGEESQRLEQTHIDEQLAHALHAEPSREDTSHDEELARQIAAQFEATPPSTAPTNTTTSQQLFAKPPPGWWTTCPNCSADSNRRYHLIEITPSENEWISITHPLRNSGFVAKRLLRIQNMKLYQRLQFEKESMKMDRTEEDDHQVNEKLLYHTSSADVSVICGEGLDQRLSRKGRFGSGVYFSDDPAKCHAYWKGSGTKKMFACYVLLGTIKEYPPNTTDWTLVREPTGYDSVKGNVTGQDEYIIYSNYRAMPAYVIEYT